MRAKPVVPANTKEKLRAISVLLNTQGGALLDSTQQLLNENSCDEANITKVRTICLAVAFLNWHLKSRRSGIVSAVAKVKQVGRRSGIAARTQMLSESAAARKAKIRRGEPASSNGNGTAADSAGDESAA